MANNYQQSGGDLTEGVAVSILSPMALPPNVIPTQHNLAAAFSGGVACPKSFARADQDALITGW